MLAGVEWRRHHPQGAFPSFWWSGLYSTFGVLTWGKIATEWIEAQGNDDALMVHVNCRQARTWQVKRDAPADTTLAACVDVERAPGVIPDDALLLTAGVDVQKAVAYFVIRAWGKEGRSWLIAHGTIERDGEGLDRLDEVLATLYGGREVRQVLIDSGWDEEVVYDFCLRRRNCAPCKGIPAERPYVIKEAEQTREKGQYLGRRFSLWMVNSCRIREHIHDRIVIPAGEPRCWRMHAEVGPDYRRHIAAWARQEKRIKGRATVEWVQLRKDDHWLDAEVYAMAAVRLPHIAPLLLTDRKARPLRPLAAIMNETQGYDAGRGPIRREY